MGLDALIKRNWQRISDRTAGTSSYWLLSPTYWTLRKDLERIAAAHAKGRILDAGAGRLAHRDILERAGSSYTAVDVEPRSGDVAKGDLLCLPFEDASFEMVFCSQVLEHVKDPVGAVKEMARVLTPDGKLILTAPHLAYLHNEPHDYWRFTEYGLRRLMEEADLTVVETAPSGGLIAYLAHIPITLSAGLFGTLPVIGPLVLWKHRLSTRILCTLDKSFGMKKRFALNHLIVAVKFSGRRTRS